MWPTHQEAYAAEAWALRSVARSRIAPADLATFDSLVAGLSGSQASVVVAAGAAAAAVAG